MNSRSVKAVVGWLQGVNSHVNIQPQIGKHLSGLKNGFSVTDCNAKGMHTVDDLVGWKMGGQEGPVVQVCYHYHSKLMVDILGNRLS
jgi:hypothetical protein